MIGSVGDRRWVLLNIFRLIHDENLDYSSECWHRIHFVTFSDYSQFEFVFREFWVNNWENNFQASIFKYLLRNILSLTNEILSLNKEIRCSINKYRLSFKWNIFFYRKAPTGYDWAGHKSAIWPFSGTFKRFKSSPDVIFGAIFEIGSVKIEIRIRAILYNLFWLLACKCLKHGTHTKSYICLILYGTSSETIQKLIQIESTEIVKLLSR